MGLRTLRDERRRGRRAARTGSTSRRSPGVRPRCRGRWPLWRIEMTNDADEDDGACSGKRHCEQSDDKRSGRSQHHASQAIQSGPGQLTCRHEKGQIRKESRHTPADLPEFRQRLPRNCTSRVTAVAQITHLSVLTGVPVLTALMYWFDAVLPQYQDILAGDEIPIGRGGGFPVRSVEPGRSLVLGGEAGGIDHDVTDDARYQTAGGTAGRTTPGA
jgi:hypothetical protein